MANQEHLDILKQGVEVWNKWRREHSTNIWPPVLKRFDLTDANLSRVDLSKADFSEAVLSGAYLDRADLRGAEFY